MIKTGTNQNAIPSFNKDLKRLLELLKEPSFAEKVTELVYPFFVDFLKKRKTNYIVISWNRFTGDLVSFESEEDFYLGMFGADLFSYFGIFSIILNEDVSLIDYLKIEEIIKIGFFRQTVNKDNLKNFIHNTLLIEIKKLTEIYVEILVSDNYNALFEREARGLLTPLDVLSKEKQFEVFWGKMSLFKKIELESFKPLKVPLYQYDVEKIKLSFITDNIVVNEPILYAFDYENQKLVIQEPFDRYKEQIDDYLIDLLNSADQTLKQKAVLVDLIDSIIYHNSNKKLKSALDEFTNNTFLKLYLTDKLDEMKEDINSSWFFNPLYRDSHEYKIQNLFHESLMPRILNKSRTDFVVFTKPFIMESLVSFFEYLKQKWNEQINSNKNKSNFREAIFQSELELIRIIKSQIHPEILSEIRAYYKGEHPLL
jgi:hypothetical protein